MGCMQHSIGLEIFEIFAVGTICENKFTSFNFTLYKCQLILPKQNIHQITKLQNVSSAKMSYGSKEARCP